MSQVEEFANQESEYEGLQEDVRSLELPALEVFNNQYSDRDYEITMETLEFTCICPKTGQPDFAAIRIVYTPRQLCIELKSLKLYLGAFRKVGIFHEHAVNRILDDFTAAAQPARARVEGSFNSRGGIQTTVAAESSLD
ncbi:MAG: NADPH-dependent 7-cyano-7-deazaguanine reductase QueF [Gemmatimonadetes bacterium]|nr:NADPH-dependent 7-cyano-7-deazaguanine reductase QueF [Gemmatimonadota bacterium]